VAYTQIVYGKERSVARHARHDGPQDVDPRDLHGYAIGPIAQTVFRMTSWRWRKDLSTPPFSGSNSMAVDAEWEFPRTTGERAFYSLTPTGRKALASETARYRRMTGAIARVMGMA